ncbi:RHS repeat-associated core domain protein-containing protein [Chryseobacterium sp. StRB126]|nr:RHS repeat-associated core domain protein-containing protein [Chryseobacterium sp. StRB126]
MKKILIPVGILLISHSAYAQLTQGENYIQSKTYLDYNGTTPSKKSQKPFSILTALEDQNKLLM